MPRLAHGIVGCAEREVLVTGLMCEGSANRYEAVPGA